VQDVLEGVTMTPMINAMLEACFFSLGGRSGTTWVLCAPTDQGKTVASQFLIHGVHNLCPKRSLKIDATNMTNFAKECAEYLNCGAAEPNLSQLLCEALGGTAVSDTDGKSRVAKASAKAIDLAGKCLCAPGQIASPGDPMQMRDAEQHKILKVETDGEEPAPILVIDNFYEDTKKNEDFVKRLLRDAAAQGIIVFLMTRDEEWASKLIKLNGGTKCKPLHCNVNNEGYDGSKRFTGTALWNGFYWPVGALRELIRPMCQKYGLDEKEAVPDNAKLTPGEANKIVSGMRLRKILA
jgi:hypothetical protein